MSQSIRNVSIHHQSTSSAINRHHILSTLTRHHILSTLTTIDHNEQHLEIFFFLCWYTSKRQRVLTCVLLLLSTACNVQVVAGVKQAWKSPSTCTMTLLVHHSPTSQARLLFYTPHSLPAAPRQREALPVRCHASEPCAHTHMRYGLAAKQNENNTLRGAV